MANDYTMGFRNSAIDKIGTVGPTVPKKKKKKKQVFGGELDSLRKKYKGLKK